jgi:hypothetical protein
LRRECPRTSVRCRRHFDGLVEHEGGLVCLASGGHFRVANAFFQLLNGVEQRPKAVGVIEINAEGVHVEIGRD